MVFTRYMCETQTKGKRVRTQNKVLVLKFNLNTCCANKTLKIIVEVGQQIDA